jgi:hypothetical protein
LGVHLAPRARLSLGRASPLLPVSYISHSDREGKSSGTSKA